MPEHDEAAQRAADNELCRRLVGGEQVSVTLRIPGSLRDAAKEEAALGGMSFSAFVRTCMIDGLTRSAER